MMRHFKFAEILRPKNITQQQYDAEISDNSDDNGLHETRTPG